MAWKSDENVIKIFKERMHKSSVQKSERVITQIIERVANQ